MKLEEVNTRTKEAVDYLVHAGVRAECSPHAYLAAMAKFRNYSFCNIMLIARQKPDATTLPDSALGPRLAASSGVAKKAFSFSPQWSATKQERRENAEPNTDATGESAHVVRFPGRVCVRKIIS